MGRWQRRISVALLLMFFILFAWPASADSYDYVIDGDQKIFIPKTYVYSYSINRLQKADEGINLYFDQPTDLRIDNENNLYVADTKNNRVVKMTTEGVVLQIYSSANGVGFKQPKGVCPAADGTIYISDTGNSRIVHLNADGTFINQFGLPDSAALADVTVYSPTQIYVSPTGGLYVLMGENIMSINDKNEFRGYVGQADIGFNFVDWLIRVFASEKQKIQLQKRTAASYISMYVNDKGLIYATCQDATEGQIKVLNSVGNNIYKKLGSSESSINFLEKLWQSVFPANIITKPFRYGEVINGENPLFTGIAVDKNGVITVVQKQNGKLYQYDQSGNLLTVFGGLGTNQGEFAIPAALAVDEQGRIFVLDSSFGNIQVFSPTDFIMKVQQATVLYNKAQYQKAAQLWEEVLDIDATYPLAHIGVGSTAYKAGNYQDAMKSFRMVNERALYSKAFSEYRYLIIKEYFLIIVAGGVAIVAALAILLYRMSIKSRRVLNDFTYYQISRLSFPQGLWMGVSMVFRGTSTTESLKSSRKRLNLYSAFAILALAVAARFFFIYTAHYPLQDVELNDVHPLLEIAGLLLPFFTWVLSVYLVSSQFSGESTFDEILVTSAYCMVPYVLVIPLASLMSHLLGTDEKGLFAFLVNGVIIWIFWLMFRMVMILNDYSVGRTLVICLVSICAMVLIWFVLLLGYALLGRMAEFVKEIFQEAMLL